MAEIVEVEVTLTGPAQVASVVISEAPGADGAPGTNGTNGVDGADGAAGADGADGVGVPAGGTTGQVLAKASGTDYDTAWSSAAGGVSDGDKGDITVSSTGTVWTIDAGSVTLAKMANLAASKLIGRYTGSTGVPETITVGTDFSLSGGTLSLVVDPTNASLLSSGTLPDGRFPATLPAASGANLTSLNASNLSSGTLPIARIADGDVTLAKLANLAASKLLGRYTGSTGVPEAITVGAEFSLSGGTLALSSDPTNASNLTSGTLSIARVADGSVTLAKLANLTQSVILGRYTASTGVPESIAVGGDFSLSGGTLSLVVNPTNASNLASGTVADGRLSSNVPLLNAANTFTAANTVSTNGAASTPVFKLTGTPYTGGTGTTTHPLAYWNAGTAPTTWSTAGTYLGFNAPSGFTGNFLDFHVNGAASVASITYQGFIVGSRFVDTSSVIGIFSGTARFATSANISFSSTTGYTGTADVAIKRNAAGVIEVNTGSAGVFADIKARNVICDNTLQLKGFTVATLPAGTVGMRAYVTDATAPTYLGALTGGGAVVCPVFYNGSAWISS